MITISVGQAILLLIKRYQDNQLMKRLLSKLYINGINTSESLEIVKEQFQQAGLSEKYEISTEQRVINEDPTRRYFETHLSHETLKTSLNHVELDWLKGYFAKIYNELNDNQREKIDGYLSGQLQPSDDQYAREYLDALNRIKADDNYACYSGVQKEKLTLIVKCAWLGVVIARKMPLDIYGAGLFSEVARGRVAKATPQRVASSPNLSRHFGLMKSYMPVPRDDVTFAEKGFEFLKPVDMNNFNPQADWPRQCFSTLIHPFSCSLSGTMLAQMRFMKHLTNKQDAVFPEAQQFTSYVRSLTSALLFNSGGHSYYEFLAVLSLPQIRQAFQGCQWFTSLSLETIMLTGNEAAIDQALADTIQYHDVLLAKQAFHSALKQ